MLSYPFSHSRISCTDCTQMAVFAIHLDETSWDNLKSTVIPKLNSLCDDTPESIFCHALRNISPQQKYSMKLFFNFNAKAVGHSTSSTSMESSENQCTCCQMCF